MLKGGRASGEEHGVLGVSGGSVGQVADSSGTRTPEGAPPDSATSIPGYILALGDDTRGDKR